jgi:hypothetical protein
MIYSIPYVIITLIYGGMALYYAGLSDEEDGVRIRNLNIACIVLFMLFFGFRGFIGDDWMVYYKYFQNCTWDGITFNVLSLSDDYAYEPGFTIMALLCRTLFDSYEVFQILCSAINCALLYLFLQKYIRNIPLGFMIYICMGGFLMSINLMRNTIAILIMANAIDYIFARKPLQYYGACILALSFHFSSIFFVPLYFVGHKQFNKRLFIAIFFIGNLIYFSQTKLALSILTTIAGYANEKFAVWIENYTVDNYASAGLSIGYLERLLTGILILCYYDKLVEIRQENKFFITAYLIYFSFYFFIWEFDILASRLANLFSFFYWVLWIDILSCFSIVNNKRLFIVFLSVYSIMKVIGLSHFITYDYDNMLTGAKSYNERQYIHESYKYRDD